MTFTAKSPDGKSFNETHRPEIVTISSGSRGLIASMTASETDTPGTGGLADAGSGSTGGFGHSHTLV